MFTQTTFSKSFEVSISEEPGRALLSITLLNNKFTGSKELIINSSKQKLSFLNGNAYLPLSTFQNQLFFISDQKLNDHQLYYIKKSDNLFSIRFIPLWLSILPPLIAIFLALIYREVILSIGIALFIGAFISNGLYLTNLPISFLQVIDKYVLQALSNSEHLSIILFSMLIAGIVHIISKNRGLEGVVLKLSAYVNSSKKAQLATWFLGILVFFDDYANTLIVGNTIRPITDRFRVSREKLAYIVDSTAAPVAAIAFVTTWIGAELSYIETATEPLGINKSAYSIFFSSLKYAYYPIFTLLFILFLIIKKRDYGPMYHAENKSQYITHKTQLALFKEDAALDKKANWLNAFLPIFTVLIVTFIGLLYTGYEPSIWQTKQSFVQQLAHIFGNANPYQSLTWGAVSGLLVAFVLSSLLCNISLKDTTEHMLEGFKYMVHPVVILTLAWSLATITTDLHTTEFFLSFLHGAFNPIWLPALVFVLSALISFSTGSSWGTMAILYPSIIPLSWALGQSYHLPYEQNLEILYNVISVVLAGSVFGDHCSPISDTTILSSLASECDHIAHVKTQLPYAITVGITSIFVGGIVTVFSDLWWLNYLIGIVALYLVVVLVGKKNTT